jgi:hypothetical protein
MDKAFLTFVEKECEIECEADLGDQARGILSYDIQ